MKTIKVKFIRIHDTGTAYYAKGIVTDLPEAEAIAFSKGKKPTVEILKEKV